MHSFWMAWVWIGFALALIFLVVDFIDAFIVMEEDHEFDDRDPW